MHPSKTIIKTFLERVKSSEDQTATISKNNNRWYGQTYSFFYKDVRAITSELLEQKAINSKIGILGANSPEFYKADLAIQAVKSISILFPETISTDELIKIANQLEIKYFICTSQIATQFIKNNESSFIHLNKVFFTYDSDLTLPSHKYISLHIMNKTLEKIKNENFFEDLVNDINENIEYSISIIEQADGSFKQYSSTHSQMISILNDIWKVFCSFINLNEEKILSYIHPSNFQGKLEFYAGLLFGWMQYFASDFESLSFEIKEVKPTILIANPKLLNLIYKRHKQKQYSVEHNIKFIISAGEYLSEEVIEFFDSKKIPILSCYGIPEAGGVISINTLDSIKIGSVGKPLPEVLIKISDKSEILIKSNKINNKLYNNDNWFHTGDIGYIDDDGFLFVTDIKSEVITLNSGQRICPRKIEKYFITNRLISNVVIAGQKKPYITAIINPNKSELIKKAKENRIFFKDYNDLLQNCRTHEMLEIEIDGINKSLPLDEKIHSYIITPNEFSIATGEISTGGFLKRKFCINKYKKEIEKLYEINK